MPAFFSSYLLLPTLSNDYDYLQTNAKSADAFYESLEKIVNELKSTVRLHHRGIVALDFCLC